MQTKYKYILKLAILVLTLSTMALQAQSIAEKKASLKEEESGLDRDTEQFLMHVNKETEELHEKIKKLYDEAFYLYDNDASEGQYQVLLDEINQNKQQLLILENSWRDASSKSNRPEGYGLWHAPDTTLEQLIIDYGSQDYVYLIPPEVASIKLSIDSNLPIPRASWDEMLELIMTQNGVGVKTLNPYLRQLYLVKQNNSGLKVITNNREDLEVLPDESRATFVLSPEVSEVRRAYQFLEKFVNPNSTVLQAIGRDILITGPVGDLKDLLKLYDFIACNRGEKEYRLVPVFKIPAQEMAKILGAVFDNTSDSKPIVTESEGKHRSSSSSSTSVTDTNGLRVITLEHMAQGIFLVGTREEVRKGEEIVRNVESQIGGAREKQVFWYTVKHSEAEELADVLYRVYNLMIATDTGIEKPKQLNAQNEVVVIDNNNPIPPPILPPPPEENIISPALAVPGEIAPTVANNNRDNFIVDIKTGSIVMVVEVEVYPKLRDLIRRLDIPKKMVQIETLLFEKIYNKENNFGMNLLRIGDIASQTHLTGVNFNDICPKLFKKIFHDKNLVSENRGVFSFFMSRERTDSGIPAFDLAYRFLLNQDNIQINSCPSILTLNQQPSSIKVTEEISLNTGINEIETARGTTLKDSFTRAQYGITISLKPTIHMRSEEDVNDRNYNYVTLETDIVFDTTVPGGKENRPNVIRRQIKNLVDVPDGQTIILGGLRRRITNDKKESIPYIGELPGIGKLFSMTSLKDSTSEMFIFITPRIVVDPKEQLILLRQELLCRRPGDLPYFLECLEEASEFETAQLMQGTLEMLIGRRSPRYYETDQGSMFDDTCPQDYPPIGEYDGR